MSTDFERTRLDVAGRGVTITSWYEFDKQRFRASVPAFLHLLNEGEVAEGSTAPTREGAIQAVCRHLAKRLVETEAKRR